MIKYVDDHSCSFFFSLSPVSPLKKMFIIYKYLEERLALFEELGVGVSIWEIGQGLEYFVCTFFLYFR